MGDCGRASPACTRVLEPSGDMGTLGKHARPVQPCTGPGQEGTPARVPRGAHSLTAEAERFVCPWVRTQRPRGRAPQVPPSGDGPRAALRPRPVLCTGQPTCIWPRSPWAQLAETQVNLSQPHQPPAHLESLQSPPWLWATPF